jgi:hypothetical protein
MVRRMTKRALVLAPILFVVLALAHSVEWGISGVVGVAMTLANLWLAARVIGGVADNNPPLLLPAALGAFALGLALLTGLTFVLRATGLVYFPVTGFTLIGTHFLLVLWEAAGAYGKTGDTAGNYGKTSSTVDARS